MTALMTLWRDPALRTVTLTLFLLGAFAGALAPYVSLLGVEVFGLGGDHLAAEGATPVGGELAIKSEELV